MMSSISTQPYVAFYPEPGSAQSRFLIQGYVDREQIATAAELLVDLLDEIDGDPDLEGECSEDEISRCDDMGRPVHVNEPGCPISDPGGCENDGREQDWGI